ncbi:MAG TPA: hypothetical protein VEI57_09865 [Nitrospirota bacterium]|nr:hypothetical protein [Nitrospirota bacterium]
MQNLLSMPSINGITINDVQLSSSVVSFFYTLIAIIFVCSFVISLKKYTFLSALKKGVIITFFSAGIVYSIHADIGWSTWLINDNRVFGGLGTDEKLSRMEAGLYDFTLAVRKVIDDDYVLFSSDIYLPLRMEYFLLPHRKRDQAKYIVVLVDKEAHYDQVTHTFTRGDVRIDQVVPVLVFANDAYVLMRQPS